MAAKITDGIDKFDGAFRLTRGASPHTFPVAKARHLGQTTAFRNELVPVRKTHRMSRDQILHMIQSCIFPKILLKTRERLERMNPCTAESIRHPGVANIGADIDNGLAAKIDLIHPPDIVEKNSLQARGNESRARGRHQSEVAKRHV